MKVSSSLNDAEIKELLRQFYEYFNRANASETGRAFEEFLREYLIKMGLDEVVVTQRSRDGGIDLTAIRKGFGDFSETDIIKYYIQAKRNSPISAPISNAKVRELKGTIPFGHKGIFITTTRFSDPAIAEADNDPSKPVVLIDGKSLLLSCIDNEIGFVFKPIFSKVEMDSFMCASTLNDASENISLTMPNINYVEKIITSNDIRARILSVPRAIFEQLGNDVDVVTVKINADKEYQCSVRKPRNYLASVTDLLRDNNLLTSDGVYNPKMAKWFYDPENSIVNIVIEV
jgi:restriction system protein